eukprot:5783555-Pyramimonas_sp.AAC.1
MLGRRRCHAWRPQVAPIGRPRAAQTCNAWTFPIRDAQKSPTRCPEPMCHRRVCHGPGGPVRAPEAENGQKPSV